jgi:hypothetical protein
MPKGGVTVASLSDAPALYIFCQGFLVHFRANDVREKGGCRCADSTAEVSHCGHAWMHVAPLGALFGRYCTVRQLVGVGIEAMTR